MEKYLEENRPAARRRKILHSVGWMLLGNLLFAVGVNLFIIPMNLFGGGFTGITQLVRLFLLHVVHVPVIPGVDLVGIIFFCLNVPLFILAYRIVGKKFCLRALFTSGLLSLMLEIVPVLSEPIFDDYLTTCIVGGVAAGAGTGMALRAGSAQGGNDIIGVILSISHPNFSVGKVTIIINLCIYTICFFLFDIKIVIYSVIYSVVLSVAIDKVHTQNINVEVLIMTPKPDVQSVIIEKLNRGVTIWEGRGGYTDQNMHILVTVISKYEVERLREIVESIDEHAFITVAEGIHIYGNYRKKLGV